MGRVNWKLGTLVGLLLATFFAGSVLACSGNYCPSVDTTDCVSLDMIEISSCCLALDSSGTRCWTCSREQFWCDENLIIFYGPPFNCHSPGGACN